MSPERHYNEREASEYLFEQHGIRREPSTLSKMRSTGGGPRFRKVNRNVDYPESGLDEWARSKISGRTYSSTSEYQVA